MAPTNEGPKKAKHSEAFLIALRGPCRGRVFVLNAGTSTLGRAPENVVVLPDLKISRRHASIHFDETGAIIADMGSGNGTLVDGERITHAELLPGGRIQIGDSLLHFQMKDDDICLEPEVPEEIREGAPPESRVEGQPGPEGEPTVQVYAEWPFDASEAKRRQRETSDALGLPVEMTNYFGMEFVLIPAGEFMMGSPESDPDALTIEKPQHRVVITKPFYLGKYPVTQQQYGKFMETNPSYFKLTVKPVDKVTRDDSAMFCEELSKREGVPIRLPTEAEWEHACRAGTHTRFEHGDDSDGSRFDEHAWYGKNSERMTHPVGEKKPNPWGLHDMHGDVWEWCLDGRRIYSSSTESDPRGPDSGTGVLRGGAWDSFDWGLRSAFRFDLDPSEARNYSGFRALIEVSLPE